MRSFFIIICLLHFFICIAQEKKIEREVRLKEKAVPDKILELLAPHSSRITKVRYYKENNGKDYTFEAKVLVGGHHYSIEFSKSLILEDIEKIIPFDSIPEGAGRAINQEFAIFRKFKVDKTQIQFSSSELTPEQMIHLAFENGTPGTIRYEIVVTGMERKKRAKWEMLFSSTGELIKKQEIDVRPHDFILY